MSEQQLIKILFVCAGNICRSPTAEGIFTRLVQEADLHDFFFIDSAGTNAMNGGAPDPRSCEEALRHGLDISGQRSRRFERHDAEEFDYILVMDSGNERAVKAVSPPHAHAKIERITRYFDDTQDSVPDPYTGLEGFREVYRLLEHCCKNLLDEVINDHPEINAA